MGCGSITSDNRYRKGLLKGITAVSAIFALLLGAVFVAGYIAPASAAVTQATIAEFKLTPNVTYCGAANTYTVEVKTLPSSAPIRTFLIFNGTAYPGKYINIPPHDSFACGPAPAGWTLFNLYPPFPICQYMANTDADMIEIGDALNFTFTARTTTQSNYNWSFEAYDNGGTNGLWQPVNMSMTVDCTAPVTTKSFIGPFKEDACFPTAEGGPPPGCRSEWIDGVTQIRLDAADDVEHNSGVKSTYWRNTLVDEEYCRITTICNVAEGEGDFNLYTGPFQKNEESCHLLEFYSVDNMGNAEDRNVNCFFVDKKPPVVEKDNGEPKIPWEGDYAIYPNLTSTGDGRSNWSDEQAHSGDYSVKMTTPGTADQGRATLPFGSTLGDINSFTYWDYTVNAGTFGQLAIWASIYLDDNGDGAWDYYLQAEPYYTYGPPTLNTWLDYDAYNMKWESAEGPDCPSSAPTLGDYISGAATTMYCPNSAGPFASREYGSLDIIKIDMRAGYGGPWAGFIGYTDDVVINGNPVLSEPAFFVSPETDITFTCTDQPPHPSGSEELCYRVSFDQPEYPTYLTSSYCSKYGGSLEDIYGADYCCVPATPELPFVFNFNAHEDSLHDLEYFCRDAVNKSSVTEIQYYKVDDTPPAIEKDMMGSWLGDCPSGSDIDHGDCYVADNGESGVRVTPVDAGLHKSSVSCSYEVWWHTDEDTCSYNGGYWTGGRCRLEGPNWQGEFTEPVDIMFSRDSTHDLEIFCEDKLGNEFYDTETFLVDSTPPETLKTYGLPFHGHEDGTHWISTETPVTLSAGDNKAGVDKTYWRNFLAENDQPCQHLSYCNPEFFQYYADAGTDDDVDVSGADPEILESNGGASVHTFSPALAGPADFDTDYYYGVHAESGTDAADVHWEIAVTSDGGSLSPGDVQLEEVGWYDPSECSIISPPGGCPNTGSETYVFASDGSGGLAASGSSGWSVASGEDFNNVDRIRFASSAPAGKYTVKRQLVRTDTGEVLGEWTQKVVAGWNVYTVPFTKDEESCHLIEYYSTDKLGNAEEPKRQCVFVDDTPPETDKTIGEPKTTKKVNVTVCTEPDGITGLSFSTTAVGDLVMQHNVSTFDYPGYTNFCSVGLAFDGSSLYYDRCSGDDRIYRVHPLTGALEGIQDTGLDTEPNAMAYDATRNGIWFGTQGCAGGGMPIYFWDFDDNSTTLMFTVPSSLINPATGSSFVSFCFLDGLAFNANNPEDPLDDELWFSDDVNRNLGLFRPNGTLITGYDATDTHAELGSLSGLAIGGSNLYMGNNGGGVVFRANKNTLAFVDKFTSISDRVEDMECDPKTFAPKEVMWIRHTPQGIAADDLITAHEIEPGTCGYGGVNVTCGDGAINQPSEECDDGNLVNGDGCSADCKLEVPPACGNGVVEIGEECDDGNLVNGDGCSSTCELEVVCHDVEVDQPYITSETPITLACEDPQPHPVDHVSLFYRYRVSYDCNTWSDANWTDWIDPNGEVVEKTVYLPQDSCHQLEYYCVDTLGNAGPVMSETDIVDNQPPVITKTVIGPQVGDCPPDQEGDTCIIDGVTKIHIEASDPEPHPAGGVKCDWSYYVAGDGISGGESDVTPPFDINFPEESQHELEITCRDALGNAARDAETFFVDKTPPVTHKRYDGPLFENENGEWITTKTDVVLSAADNYGPHDSGVHATFWRSTLVDDTYCNGTHFIDDDNETNDDLLGCEDAPNGTAPWNPYTAPFTIGEESCHLIEFYSVDNVEKNETPKRQCAFVDDAPPVPDKTVGVPKEMWDGKDAQFYNLSQRCWSNGSDSLDCWKITMLTPVTLDCSDPEPHPAGHENVYFNVELDGDDATGKYCDAVSGSMQDNGYCLIESGEAPVQFHFLEESEHNLRFYCADALGNNGTVDDEKFKVEGTAFTLNLFKKWNLISVPFVLFNDDIEAVFNETKNNISVVWAYDGATDTWFVWTPGPAPDTLHKIQPGWGYWVLAKNDTTLKLAGSLFSTLTAPPHRNLVKGWNLVGPYGTDWQEYDEDPFCPYNVHPSGVFADYAYCSLNTLIDPQSGNTRWNSLWTYVNCPGVDLPWKGLNACTTDSSKNKMVVGYGYWLDMDVADIYSPPSTCMRNTGCVYFTPS